ncbi:MAG: lipoprotein [Gammaproteobacteria bacterium]
MSKITNYLLLVTLGLLFLSGCGQTGPLYLPEDPAEVEEDPVQAQDEGVK